MRLGTPLLTPWVKVLLLALVTTLSACGKEPLYEQQSYVFGTQVEVSIYGEPDAKARTAAAAVL